MRAANRILWIVIGLVLALGGIAVVMISAGWMPGTDRDVTLLTDQMRDRWREWNPWALAGVIVAGVIVALLGIILMRLELRRRGGRGLPDVVYVLNARDRQARQADGYPPPGNGRTRVGANVLSAALKRDLQLDPYVRRASVRLTGSAGKPQLRLRLQVSPEADLSEVRLTVAEAVNRFRTTSNLAPTLRETVVRVA